MKKMIIVLLLLCSMSCMLARAWWHELTFDHANRRYVTPNGKTVTKYELIAFTVQSLNKGLVQEAQRWLDMALRAGAHYQDFKDAGLKPALGERNPNQCVRIGDTPHYFC